MTGIEDVLLWSLAQKGDTYVFGAPFNKGKLNPTEFDCSGLVAWSCRHSGVAPKMPRGSWIQATHCHIHGKDISIAEAVTTRGAMLFKFNADPFTATTRPTVAHVAFSLGDGTTMEAASKTVGVGVLSSNAAERGWTHAARIPGVDYDQPLVEEEDEDEMVTVNWYADPDGAAHPYAVSGVTGKFLNEESLNTYLFLQTEVRGKREAPLGSNFSAGVALLDGPCKNV